MESPLGFGTFAFCDQYFTDCTGKLHAFVYANFSALPDFLVSGVWLFPGLAFFFFFFKKNHKTPTRGHLEKLLRSLRTQLLLTLPYFHYHLYIISVKP